MFGLWKKDVEKCCHTIIDIFRWQRKRLSQVETPSPDKMMHPKSLGYISGFLRAYLEEIGITNKKKTNYALQYVFSELFQYDESGNAYGKFVFYHSTQKEDLLDGMNLGYNDYIEYRKGNDFVLLNWAKLIANI